MDYELIEKLEVIIEALMAKKGFDLVELKLRTLGKERILSILVDRPCGGIILDECTMLNEEIHLLLEGEPLLGESYSLEVSSPGLDRPLVERKDFLRVIKRNLRIFLKDEMSIGTQNNKSYIFLKDGSPDNKGVQDKKKEFVGELTEVGDDTISLDTERGLLVIPLNNITKAKQIYEKSR